MTKDQFIQASRRVTLWGNLHMGLVASVLITLYTVLISWAGPLIQGFGQLMRSYFQDEGTVGLVGGLVFSVFVAPVILIPFLAALRVDRRFGLRCPRCGRSVTARCRPAEVLRTGQCCHCRQVLFEPNDR